MATLEQIKSLWNYEMMNYRKLLIQKGNARHLTEFDRWFNADYPIDPVKRLVYPAKIFRNKGLIGTSQNDAAPAELLVEFDRIIAESKEMIAVYEAANQQPLSFWAKIFITCIVAIITIICVGCESGVNNSDTKISANYLAYKTEYGGEKGSLGIINQTNQEIYNIKINCEGYSKTNTYLGSSTETIYEYIPANSTRLFDKIFYVDSDAVRFRCNVIGYES